VAQFGVDWVASLPWNGWPLCVEYAAQFIEPNMAENDGELSPLFGYGVKILSCE